MRVVLQDRLPAVHRPAAIGAAQERAGQPVADLLRHLVQVQLPPGSGRALDREIVAEEERRG